MPSFYTMLRLRPTGTHVVSVCTNLSCALRGANDVFEAEILGVLALNSLYNYARFGAPFDTGYDYIATSGADRTIITERSEGIGLFSYNPVTQVV